MYKMIFVNLDVIFAIKDYLNSKTFKKFILGANELCSDEENAFVFESMHIEKIKAAKIIFKILKCKNFKVVTRKEVKDIVMSYKNRNNLFVFLSGKEQDFHIAVQAKALFIVPTWIPSDKESMNYGIHVDTPAQLFKFIRTLNNQNHWFSKLEIEPDVMALSLMDARYGYYAKSKEEKEMLLHFQGLLKEEKHRNYYDILLYHFLAGMTNTTLFDDIELFGMIPSSDGSLNPDMYKFMTQVRYIKGKRLPKNGMQYDNLFIRHTSKKKAHETYKLTERVNLKATDEFKTMILNPDFKDKIQKLKQKNKFNVMIFDDYMTHGNTFNAVRNLLKSEGANKIIFVSLGSFDKPFQKHDYKITGSVYKPGYKADLITSNELNCEHYIQAKDEVVALYDIFNS